MPITPKHYKKTLIDFNLSNLTVEDVLIFLKFNLKILLFFSFVGLACSILFLLNKPTFYTGIATVELGKTVNLTNYPNGTSIQEPVQLIFRVKSQLNSNANCKLDNVKPFHLSFQNELISIKTSKSLPNAIEITLTMDSQNKVEGCLADIVKLIIENQSRITKSYTDSLKNQITLERKSIIESGNQIKLLNLNDNNFAFLYSYYKNQIYSAEVSISNHQKILDFHESYLPSLASGIDFSKSENALITLRILLIGLLFGFFLGLFFCLIKKNNHPVHV
jgi:hypothetical protein